MAEGERVSIGEILSHFKWHWRSWHEIKSMSLFSKFSYTNFFLFVGFVIVAIYQARSKAKAAQDAGPNKRYLPAKDFPDIEELSDFSWKDQEPFKIRAFKPKYFITMALQKLNPSELILMDKNYLDRIEYRKKVMKEHRDIALGVNDDALINGAVRELYNWLMGTYLPKRYPQMFRLHHASFETGDMYMLENFATKAVLPAKADKTANTLGLLENLGKTMDEDFLFLKREDVEEGKEQDAKYVLQALVTICPSGWDPREKLGKRLAEIHGPVPGYKKVLEGSMDRHFAKVEVGNYVVRTNWNITTDTELFAYASDSNHAHEGDDIKELDEVNLDTTFLRCERQTLHRLPDSKVVVFAFKTYLYSLREIKDEGLGEELAQAIDGMKEGNVPAMHFYKRGVVWAEAVKRYLRA